MTLTLEEFLKKNPKPNEEEVKEAISGNLCRCTGYIPIIRAVMDYVKIEEDKMEEFKYIGKR